MNAYLLTGGDEKFDSIECINESDVYSLNKLSEGKLVGQSWTPVAVRVVKGSASTNRATDFPTLDGIVPVFSEKAATALKELLDGKGELLPLLCVDANLFAYNVINTVDALDESLSEFKRFSSGRVMRVVRYAFKARVLEGNSIFKIPERVGDVYVTDEFVEAVRRHGLEGFTFRRLD